MKGFIGRVGTGMLLSAAVIVTSTGCITTRYAHDQSAACGQCGADDVKRCGCHNGPIRALADKLHDADWEQVHSDHCWPEQYSREAMRRINVPFARQVAEGDRIELTIWDHQFNSDEEDRRAVLNDSGIARLNYFMRRKPFVIRSLYLQSSFDPELDAAREKAILAYLEERSEYLDMASESDPWTVAVINREPTGLYGVEAPSAIYKMTGQQPSLILRPAYEGVLKRGFTGGP